MNKNASNKNASEKFKSCNVCGTYWKVSALGSECPDCAEDDKARRASGHEGPEYFPTNIFGDPI